MSGNRTEGGRSGSSYSEKALYAERLSPPSVSYRRHLPLQGGDWNKRHSLIVVRGSCLTGQQWVKPWDDDAVWFTL